MGEQERINRKDRAYVALSGVAAGMIFAALVRELFIRTGGAPWEMAGLGGLTVLIVGCLIVQVLVPAPTAKAQGEEPPRKAEDRQ